MKPSILGRVLTRLFALFGITLTCVACYGTPYEEYRFDFAASGRVVDGEGNPIKGIEVSTMNETTLTSDDGRFYVEGWRLDSEVVKFEDIDGEANGGEFKTQDIYIDWRENYADLGDVELDKKDK